MVGSANDRHVEDTVDDSPGIGHEFYEEKKISLKKKITGRDGQIEKDREDVGTHQGADTLSALVRKSSRESGDISMSSFLAHKAGVTDL